MKPRTALVWLFVLTIGVQAQESVPGVGAKLVREFDTDTLARLGREIYQHDQLAWKATDILFAQVGREALLKEDGGGWIVETSVSDRQVVRFLRRQSERCVAAYDVTFPASGQPRLSVPDDPELTSVQQAKGRALQSAMTVLKERALPWCGGNPNSVILDDPDGSGFLVYLLRPKPTLEVIPVGGHYRFSVSADGLSVEAVDKLFASCLTLPGNDGSNGKKPVAISMSHIVSATPLETHVFLSLQEKLPFYVMTPNARIWRVEAGKMAVVR